MAVSKKFSLAVIFASATLTIMAGSIIAPVLKLMRDGLEVARSSVGLIITTHGLLMALFSPLMGSVIKLERADREEISIHSKYDYIFGPKLEAFKNVEICAI